MDSHGNGSIQGRILAIESSRHYGANRRHSHKNIHTADEEEQAKICRKLKEFLNMRLMIT
jgi:hypothetical protein